MSLRTKLLLLSLLTLVLPWAGWQYAQQMETTLRRSQEEALLMTAQVLGRVVASEVVSVAPQGSRPRRSNAWERLGEG